MSLVTFTTRILGALSLVMLLSACQRSAPQAMLEDYASRMSNVLDTEITPDLDQAIVDIPAFPDKRDRVLATKELREGLWDVLDFRQCDMLSLIAERNSSLGKVMLPSQKMRYELRFVNALQDCRQVLAAIENPDDTQLAFQTRLESIYKTKRANLALEVFNGIYSSDEISQHFKLGTGHLTLQAATNSQVQQALQQLSELAVISQPDAIVLPNWLSDVEAPYEVLHRSEFGASLLTSLSIMTQTLDKTADAIEARLKVKPFCFPGHQPARAKTLNTVFHKYYAGKVQPYMAIIQRDGLPWLTLHDELLQQLPSSKAMIDYRHKVISVTSESSLWGKWVKARQKHTKAWQTILGQCDMMPKV